MVKISSQHNIEVSPLVADFEKEEGEKETHDEEEETPMEVEDMKGHQINGA